MLCFCDCVNKSCRYVWQICVTENIIHIETLCSCVITHLFIYNHQEYCNFTVQNYYFSSRHWYILIYYLNIVWYIQLSGSWREKGRDVYTEQAGNWHVHGAQFGWRHAKKEPDAGHLVALTASKGQQVGKLQNRGRSEFGVSDRMLYSYQW